MIDRRFMTKRETLRETSLKMLFKKNRITSLQKHNRTLNSTDEDRNEETKDHDKTNTRFRD